MDENNFPRIISTECKAELIKKQFGLWAGYKPNLENPQTFNEKIQWLKLFYHDSLLTTCADKFAARKYVEKSIGKDYLVELVGRGVYGDAEHVDFDELPDKFVLKTTDGSGTNIVCADKTKLDMEGARNKLRGWMKKGNSRYYMSFEWAYKNIRPRIICEEFIEQMDGLKDYKFMCFDGRVESIFVTSERDTGHLKLDWFDRDWKHQPFTRLYPNSSKRILRPKNLEKMIELAEKLAKGFPFVRVDFYDIENSIKFSELTFYPGNGMEPFNPVEYDRKLGELLRLPKKHYFPLELNKRRPNIKNIVRESRAYKIARKIYHKIIGDVKKNERDCSVVEKWRKHDVVLEERRKFQEKEDVLTYIRQEKDKKLIAYYLPQFHPIKSNDINFGKGFTEWTNVVQGRPKYVGHLQPFLPGELGFYDLRVDDVMKRQIELARNHGVYGFCFYYYWFDGEKVLDMPINKFLDHREWNFNFSICWVNANWTRRWGDGQAGEVIFENKNKKDTPLRFIREVSNILNDTRYIQKDGKPVLTIYSIENLKEPERYIKTWRKYFKENYDKDLYIIALIGVDKMDPRTYGFDIGADFITQTMFNRSELEEKAKASLCLLDERFRGSALDYEKLVNSHIMTRKYYDFPIIPAVSPSWDNESRRRGQWDSFSFANATPELYGKWLKDVIKTSEHEFIFINAWNEWAEGAVMEPTAEYGYAVLNETARALINTRE